MSKSNASVHLRKRYFFCISLFVMFTCLLYLYTTDYKMIEPLVKVASTAFKSPSHKILNYFNESSEGMITSQDEVSARTQEAMNTTSQTAKEKNSSLTVKGVPMNLTRNTVSNEINLADITLPGTDKPTPVPRSTLMYKDQKASNTDALMQNTSADEPTQVPAKATLIYTNQTVSHTDVLMGNVSSPFFHNFSETSQPGLYQSTTNITHLQPTPTSSRPTNKSFTQSAVRSKMMVDCGQLWVTAHQAGRLGNIMCEYAHLMVLHLEYGVQVGLLPSMHNSLSPFFPKLSIQRLPLKCLQAKNITTHPWSALDVLLRDKKLQKPAASGGFPCNARRLWKYRDLWRKEFSFATSIKRKANLSLVQSLKTWKMRLWANKENSNKKNNGSLLQRENADVLPKANNVPSTERAKVINLKNVSNITIMPNATKNTFLKKKPGDTDLNRIPDPLVVGVHVRRTDYISYFKRTTGDNVVGPKYFQKAFQYFRKKFNNVMFLVSSDDRHWCHQVLEKPNKDVVVAPSGSPHQDMALLATSSHLIMSLGTYGFWSAVLSQGMVAYPKKVGKSKEYFLTKDLNALNSSELVAIP